MCCGEYNQFVGSQCLVVYIEMLNCWNAEGKTRKSEECGSLNHMPQMGRLIVDTALAIERSGVVELFVLADTERMGDMPLAAEKAWLVVF